MYVQHLHNNNSSSNIIMEESNAAADIRTLDAATMVCLRVGGGGGGANNLQVLLGQSEVKNWLRSTEQSTVIMRYPGEWKFPGGVIEECDNGVLEATAIRELREEFIGLQPTSNNTTCKLFNTKETRVVRGKKYIMHNFVAWESENSDWISTSSVAAADDACITNLVNENLRLRRVEFEKLLRGKDYYELTEQEKAQVSPEIYRVAWIPIEDAINMMASSMSKKFVAVDDWQAEQFATHGITNRDPMYQSMRVLQEIIDVHVADLRQCNKM